MLSGSSSAALYIPTVWFEEANTTRSMLFSTAASSTCFVLRGA